MNFISVVTFIFLLLQVLSSPVIGQVRIESINGLSFPSNGDEPINATVAFVFPNPQNDGLPIWGPDHQGVTWIWQYKPRQQPGYYVTFWWAENSLELTWNNCLSNMFDGSKSASPQSCPR